MARSQPCHLPCSCTHQPAHSWQPPPPSTLCHWFDCTQALRTPLHNCSPAQKDGQWIQFDDDQMIPRKEEEVLTLCGEQGTPQHGQREAAAVRSTAAHRCLLSNAAHGGAASASDVVLPARSPPLVSHAACPPCQAAATGTWHTCCCTARSVCHRRRTAPLAAHEAAGGHAQAGGQQAGTCRLGPCPDPCQCHTLQSFPCCSVTRRAEGQEIASNECECQQLGHNPQEDYTVQFALLSRPSNFETFV